MPSLFRYWLKLAFFVTCALHARENRRSKKRREREAALEMREVRILLQAPLATESLPL